MGGVTYIYIYTHTYMYIYTHTYIIEIMTTYHGVVRSPSLLLSQDQGTSLLSRQGVVFNIGAFIITIGFWGPLYQNFNKELPNSIGNY